MVSNGFPPLGQMTEDTAALIPPGLFSPNRRQGLVAVMNALMLEIIATARRVVFLASAVLKATL